MMKQIKLDKRYTLWHHGYRFALKFESWRGNFDIINGIHQTCQNVAPREALGHHIRKTSAHEAPYDGEYLIGFKTQERITETLLKLKVQ